MSVLVVAEHNGKKLISASLSTVSAAKELGGDVHILVAGPDSDDAAGHAASLDGVSKVFHAGHEAYGHGLAENIAPLIAELAADYSHILAPASFFGKNVMPRAAALLGIQQISDIIEIKDSQTYVRPIYAGNALATVKSLEDQQIVTIRATAFDAAEEGGDKAEIEKVEGPGNSGLAEFVEENLTESDRPELATADIVISGGRGVGSGEAFEHLEKVADKLGAAIGASRAAVDAGFVPNDYQVGQTGKVVAPELYIAVGISGAIQHLAGMKDSKTIVAINTDPEAPIFQVADYGLVQDWKEALTELEEKL